MTGNEYQKLASETFNPMTSLTIDDEQRNWLRLIEAVMGLSGESGECVDVVKKNIFQNHEIDREHLIEELGDVLWYIAEGATALNTDLDTIMETNIKKIRKRYPNGFDAKRSIHRDV